jgi:hypothetical protein
MLKRVPHRASASIGPLIQRANSMEFLPKKLTWRVNLDLPNLVENFFRRRRMEGEQPMKRPKNISISEPVRRIVSNVGRQALNKTWVGFSLVATGLISLWNINLDPHESGMAS